MRRRNMPIRDEEEAHVDMTPMLDIIFIMLIFFIVTTSFVKENAFAVKKSVDNASANKKSNNIGIHIDEHDIIY